MSSEQLSCVDLTCAASFRGNHFSSAKKTGLSGDFAMVLAGILDENIGLPPITNLFTKTPLLGGGVNVAENGAALTGGKQNSGGITLA